MRRELADVTNKSTAHKRRKKQKTDHHSPAEIDEIRVLGRKFTVTNMLWLRDRKHAFTTPVDEVYNPLERFDTDASKLQGQLADLRAIFPEALRNKMKDMEKNGLADAFRTGMGEQHSNISTRVRRAAGPDIFDCTSNDLLTSKSRSDKFRRQIGWIPDDEASEDGKYDPWVVDLLHRDFRGKFDLDTVFLSPKLHLIFAAIVRGVSAVALLKDGRSPIVQAETNDQIWGLQYTTPGDIAASAIAGRFALSADESLRENGTAMGINWAADYEMYLKYLTTGLDKRKASVLKIFRVWDDIFFPGRSAASGTNGSDGGSAVDVMDALNADVEEEGDGGDANEE
ncbi:hypothetical protein C8R44DRAFT_601429 [Mycena epipterygia]|nr:hypothetical protein C8R44DRAFT_601429 [Mycena epipterygia]